MREPSRDSVRRFRLPNGSKGYAGRPEIGDVVDLAAVPCYDGASNSRSSAMNPDIFVSMCPHGPGRVPGKEPFGNPETGSQRRCVYPLGSSNTLAMVRGAR